LPNLKSEIRALRRLLHQHPEPGFGEFETARILRQFLTDHGIRFRSLKTGTVVDLGRPRVAIRSDIDGLPILERTGLSYRSQNKGWMHACGHDFHMAIAMMTLMRLKEAKIKGVRIIFQPSEEGPESGAKFLIEKGVLNGIRAIFALHLEPGIRFGRIGIRSGPFMAAANHFRIVIRGKASHAALPHLGQDTIRIGARLIQDIQALIARSKNPIKPGLITIGRITGGERFNVLAKETIMEGTIRALELGMLKKLKRRLTRLAQGLKHDYGVEVETEFSEDHPPVVNDDQLVEMVIKGAIEVLGEEGVVGVPPTMGSEDFSYYQQKIPGVMFMLGCRDEKLGAIYPLHHDRFRASDSVIEPGSEILYRCVQSYLS